MKRHNKTGPGACWCAACEDDDCAGSMSRERARIRATQRPALKLLADALIPLRDEYGEDVSVMLGALSVLDRATRAPRKAREKYRGAGITSVTLDEASKWTPEQVRAFNNMPTGSQSASPANVGADGLLTDQQINELLAKGAKEAGAAARRGKYALVPQKPRRRK